MKRFRNFTTQLRNLFLILILALGQAATAVGPFLQTQKAAAAPICVVDTAGANDEPGQKDLTKLCVDEAGLPNTIAVTWNWDELGTSGNNTMDGCALFDSDNDGNINYAACVTTAGDPAVLGTLTLYSCGDAKVDRCTTPNPTIAGPYQSECAVGQFATQPFTLGAGAGSDTVATCTFVLDDFNVNINDLELTDVCSYPSQQPNSDPSDCVIIQDRSGKLEVRKDLLPGDNTGLFNLQIDGTTRAADVGDNGTTGEVIVAEGNHAVGETAGTNTLLASYSTTIECRDLNGTGVVIASSTSATLASVPVADGADVVCIITNTAAGSIAIVKDAVANSLQDFAYTTTGNGLTNFALDDDSGVAGADTVLSNTRTFNNLAAGQYTITESATAGWDLASINCGGATGVTVNGAQVTINLTAGQNVTCTYRNEQRGQIIVTKQTNPDGDPTQFSVTATGSGNIAGNATRSISDNQSVIYDVAHGTYGVTEQVPNGWTETSNNCNNLVINGNTPKVNGLPTLTCTIVNTKLVTINIVKDALPDNAQDFLFNIQRVEDNSTGSNFTLDDDGDDTNGTASTVQFTNANPGNYTVTEFSVPGWSLTGATCDLGNPSLTGNVLSFNATAGQTVTCTFTNTKLVSVSGTKYTSSATGTLGPVLAGWTIFIDANGNGVMDNGELSTVTDSNGNYSFTNLMPGSFTLNEVLLAGWTQIFGPQTFSLSPGQDATGQDFGNFQNGGISGFKWNDLNGDGQFDSNEPKLSGWTINLFRDSADADTVPDELFATTVTDASGVYSFSNLSPLPNRFYGVCEVQQSGWAQTFPAGNACHTIELDQSGETNVNTNFGNQGRGTIRVIKNVDSDGNGSIDFQDVTNWNWDIDGSGNYATGSGNAQAVAAGTYTVSEQQQTNYHVVSVVCDTQVNAVSTSAQVIIAPGASVTCTFVNARDTGMLTLVKNVVNDNGGTAQASNFTLHVKQNNVDVAGSPAAGSAVGTAYSLPTGVYSVSEDTPVAGYEQTSIVCDGQNTDQVTLTTGTNKVCTITNDDIAPQLTVIKHVINDNSGTLNAADFTMHVTATNVAPAASFPGSETGTAVTLNAGSYSVTETPVADYTATLSADCVGTIAIGQTKTCTITNTDNPHPGIHILKTGPATAHEGDTVTYTFTVTNTGDTTLVGTTVVDSITGNAVYQSGDTNTNGLLEISETWIFTTQYTIPVGQIPNVINIAVVCATDPDQTRVCDDDDHELDVLHPSITVVKSGPPLAYEGQIVGYNFTVTNTGDTTLTNVGINDDIATSETCLASVLAPAASTTCTAIYLVPVPTTNDVTNIVTASGTDPLGQIVTDTDNHTLDVIHPAINIVKTGPATAHENDTVTYTFTVTNTGDIPLSNNTVNDSVAGGASYQSGDANTNGLLDLSETWIFTKQYTIPTPQVAHVVNVGTACGLDPLQTQVCDTDDHTLDVLHPSLIVEKSGPATAYEGDPVTYTFVITNTGDTTLTNVGISDDVATGEVCLANTLAAGAFTTCVATFTIPSPQVANVTNIVTACGTDPLQLQVCDTDDHTLDVLHPTVTVNKIVDPADGDDGLFNLLVDGQVKAANVGDGGTTGAVNVTPGTHNVSETAGTETDLLDYQSSFSQNCAGGVVSVTGDENVTCIITNTRLGSITIVKDVQPDSSQAFNFSGNLTSDNNGDFSLTDDGINTTAAKKTFTRLLPGSYNVSEASLEGWDLDDINCTGGSNVSANPTGVAINLQPGENVTCTFENVQRATVVVTKYNDYNRDGQLDTGEPTLPGWDFTLTGSRECEDLYNLVVDLVYIDSGCDEFNDVLSGTTGHDGKATFENVRPFVNYELSETLLEGWHLRNIHCSNELNQERGLAVGEDNSYYLNAFPGETVNCLVGNYRDVVLNIAKANNKPNPTTVGDTVTYTLLVSVPEDSGTSFGTTVVDLPPENFTYVPGSWTAVSSKRGDIKAAGITTEPTYASPGTWILGTMLPGEVVTLTYRAVIGANVSPGTYPDVAFAQGCGLPTAPCLDEEVVYSNLSFANEPFVGTAVSIVGPQVLGAHTVVLVNTGTTGMLASILTATTILGVTLLVARRRPITKGGPK